MQNDHRGPRRRNHVDDGRVEDVFHEHERRRHLALSSAIVSGDSSEEDDDELKEDSDDIFSEDGARAGDQGEDKWNPETEGDELYDKDLDDQDETYVYKKLRGGVKEPGKMLVRPEHETKDSTDRSVIQELHMYKPRNSDAVLSCPCCFNIVCMDCQRHQRYWNQFRAMFVMGVIVDWNRKLVYDEDQQMLRPSEGHGSEVERGPVVEDEPPISENKQGSFPPWVDGEYFSVRCATCRTEVAALDMTEEVYHFHGCLESS